MLLRAMGYGADFLAGRARRRLRLPQSPPGARRDRVRGNVIVMPPGYDGFLHYHDTQDELYFIHSGTARFEIDGETERSGRAGSSTSSRRRRGSSRTPATTSWSCSWSGARTATSSGTASSSIPTATSSGASRSARSPRALRHQRPGGRAPADLAGRPDLLAAARSAIADGAEANVSELRCGVHTGTHVDAPNHFIDGAGGIETIDLDALYGPALVADVGDADAIDEAVLAGIELDGVERILFRSRNGRLWEQDGFASEFVAITPGGAQVLVDRGVRLAGVDYLSVGDAETHRILLGAGIVCLEGLDLSVVGARAVRAFLRADQARRLGRRACARRASRVGLPARAMGLAFNRRHG